MHFNIDFFIGLIFIQIIECNDIIHNEIRYTAMHYRHAAPLYDVPDTIPVHM